MPAEAAPHTSGELAAFGANVRMERQLRGLSLEALASLAGVCKDTLFRIEQGRPSTRRCRQKVCDALVAGYERMLIPLPDPAQPLAVHRLSADRWVKHGHAPGHHPLPDESERIQVEEERRRLGSLGFVHQFVRLLGCRLPAGSLVAGVLELYTDGDPATYPAGEVFVYALRGSVKVKVGGSETLLAEGEAASIRCGGEPFFFGPGEPRSGAVALYVRLDV